MPRRIELSGFEMCAGVAVCTIRMSASELSLMRVLMAALAGLRLPRVTDGV